MRRWPWLAVISLSALGCTLFNKPDPDLFRDAGDGGLDASADGGLDAGLDASFDGGLDAGDAFVPRMRETRCADGIDEDLDGPIDCADPDCASDVVNCCSAASSPPPVIDETWCAATIASTWQRVEGTMAREGSGPCYVGGTSGPDALIHTTCVPIAAGVTITANLQWDGGSCATCEAMVALTPIEDANAGGILEELAIRLRQRDSRVVLELTRAGTVLGSIPGAMSLPTTPISVVLRLYPSASETETAVIRARVEATWDGGSASIADLDVFDFPNDLVGPSLGCDVAPGLYLGVQTRGAIPRVGGVRVQGNECPNANFFRPAGAPAGSPAPTVWLDAMSLGFDGLASPWTEGGVGSGSVVPILEGGTLRWNYFFDGTNLNRANEGDQDLDFSFGGATADDPGLLGFTLRRSGEPLLGHLEPTCPGSGGMCGLFDQRDPHVFAPRDPDGSLSSGSQIFWTDVSTSAPTTSSIRRATFTPEDLDAMVASGSVVIPSSPLCRRPERPSLLTRHGGGATGMQGHFLVYLCGDRVLAQRLDRVFAPVGAPAELIAASSLGFTRGLVDVEGAVSISGAFATYRLWVAGRDVSGITRVALAEGTAEAEALPTFAPFGGNPILSIDDPLFEDCVGVCRITGIGVAREPGGGVVRVVVSVTDEAKTGVRHALIPLEQNLP